MSVVRSAGVSELHAEMTFGGTSEGTRSQRAMAANARLAARVESCAANAPAKDRWLARKGEH
jgi:hypothetical protein